MRIDMIGAATLVLVFAAWLLFGALFLLRKKSSKGQEIKRVSRAKWGMGLQGLGFALVGSFHRNEWWPFAPSRVGELVLAGIAIALAYGSCFLCLRAVQILGKQWTYEARVIQGHELIREGPYAVVRNPIYLGMFGLMMAAALAYTTWWAGLTAVTSFLAGNEIRIHSEEKLLRETFGAEFDEYAGRVPAFFPRSL